MDPKEIKAALKEARENIKNKDFKSALKICKNVLKADRNNYVGLVLFGVSLQETDQRDQAPNAFKKAIEVSPKQILAWQGLASFYEKDELKANKKELIDVYGQLLMLESDLNKFSDICTKLTAVTIDLKEYEKCISILEQQESLSSYEQKQVIWKAIVSVLENIKSMTPKLSEALESSLEKIIDDGTINDMEEHFKKYLKLLYKNKKLIALVDKARKMHILYPISEYPLEWICRAYSEQITVSAKVGKGLNVDIDQYCNKLTKLNPNSSMVILAKGAKLFQENSYVEACDMLKQVISVMPNSCYLWALLCQSYTNIYCHIDAEHCAMEALKLLAKQDSTDEHLQTMLSILLVRSLSYQTALHKVTLGIEKCKELLLVEHGNLDIVSSLTRAYITDGNLEAAQKCIIALEGQESHQATAMLMTALKLRKEGETGGAIELLNDAVTTFPSVSELWLELGKLQWEMENYDNAYISFLKAAKLDPNSYTCFVYLGHYYSFDKRDLDKARRCYQKAFHLNPRNEEAGAGLSDIYRLQKHVDLNVELLSYITEEAGPGAAKWAWLRLGLHHQEQGNHQEAVDGLRAAVRGDPTDSHCWESLADAYYARGSYTSALKSFQRVTELNPGALYPAYQVASVKLLIGQHEEAMAEFCSVVAANPSYVPALKGLGETYLALARSDLRSQALGRCRDYCQKAADVFTVAAEEHRNLSCLWKLLGDTCTMMADLPETWAYLDVKRWLVLSTQQDDKNIERERLGKDQVLQLGARCYCRALSILPNSSLIWHDLAVNYHCQSNNATLLHKKQLRDWALMAAKRSVTLNSRGWQHWNVLGVVAASNEINNFKLAQHAFIKSIQKESHNPIAWTNLGTIYSIFGEKKLANDAFRIAQRTEPSYIQCWIGQALLAESINDEDTMDLFRHTTSLGFHTESSLGYSQWVCNTLLQTKNKEDPHYIYSIEKMHAVPVAGDCMTWYTGSYPNNACALNMLGLLMERQKLYNTAANAFAKALKILEEGKGNKMPELQDKIYCNLGRVFVQLNRYEEAIHYYRLIKEASFESSCGLAVAYFKAEKYQESYESYESVLHWFATNDGLKSHVLVAMAAMAYKFEKLEDTKSLLLQCAQLKPPSVQGLFALCALGFLHGELHTSEAVLEELVRFEHDPEYLTDIAVFKAYTHYIKNRHKEAVCSLAKATHKHPGQASLWLALALLQLNKFPDCDSAAAARCAQIAMFLGQSNMDVSKVMSLVSLGQLFSSKAVPALRSAQKAVHLFPDIPENLVVLVASFLPWCMNHRSRPDVLWLKGTIGHVRRKMDATRKMGKWLSRHEHKVALLSEEYL